MAVPDSTDADSELDQLRQTLDSRYDDIKSGKVKLIPGDAVVAELRQRSAARRAIEDVASSKKLID